MSANKSRSRCPDLLGANSLDRTEHFPERGIVNGAKQCRDRAS